MAAGRIMRISLYTLAGLAVIVAAGFMWLQTTPYWAGMTLFSESKRIENFRNMDAVFPHKPVPRGASVRPLPNDPRPLPQNYSHEGELRSVAGFLDRSMTTGFVVLHNGRITHEEYRYGADETSRMTSWSVAKTILATLVGIAREDGHIRSLQDRLGDYVPELAGSAYGEVTIEQALTMSSGIAFDEDYDNPVSDVNMLFIGISMGTPMTETLAGLEKAREPGIYNNYISSDTIALGLVLEAATGLSAEEYLAEKLWGPMGAEDDAYWSTGRLERPLAFCCLNARLRDYARFGLLHLDGGVYGGRQIVPSGWLANATRATAPHLEPGDNPASFWSFGYGYHWWLPEQPRGDYLAIGIWGQYIYVDPVNDVVIVKTSADPEFDDRDHESVAMFRAIATSLGGVD